MKDGVFLVVRERLQRLGLTRVFESNGATGAAVHHSVESAVDALADAHPRALVLDLDLGSRNGLEVLAMLEELQLRIPVLVIGWLEAAPGHPVMRSPFLEVVDLGASSNDAKGTMDSAIARTTEIAAGPMFHFCDYLRLAQLFRQTLELRVEWGDKRGTCVQFVGGDVWNAYTEDHEAEQALADVYMETPWSLEAIALRTLPKKRQIPLPGSLTLQRAFRMLAHPPGADHLPEPAPSDVDPPPRGTNGTPLPSAPGLVRDPFERLLANGLHAALAHDYVRAAKAFEQAARLRPGDHAARYNLERVRRHL